MARSLLIALKPYLLRFVVASLIVFAPIKAAIIAVMALTCIDLVSGLLAAHKRKEAITSSGLKRTIVKFLVYELLIGMGYLCSKYLIGEDFIPLTKILTGYVGITELKSVLENIEELTGIPLLKTIIDRLSAPQQ
jgi:phage-related holin